MAPGGGATATVTRVRRGRTMRAHGQSAITSARCWPRSAVSASGTKASRSPSRVRSSCREKRIVVKAQAPALRLRD